MTKLYYWFFLRFRMKQGKTDMGCLLIRWDRVMKTDVSGEPGFGLPAYLRHVAVGIAGVGVHVVPPGLGFGAVMEEVK